MDDQIFHIPDQPQPSPPPPPPTTNPTPGADSAADLARAKLRAIYEQQAAEAIEQSVQNSPQTQNPESTTAQTQPEPLQPTPPPDQQPSSPQPQSHTPEPVHSYSDSPTQTPAVPTEPTPQSASDNYTPQIIQPTPLETSTGDPGQFSIPGQPAAPSPEQSSTSSFDPRQQYAQEVSLEDQIDGLRHTAPNHQLPIQSQQSSSKSWIPRNFVPFLRTAALAAVIAIIYNHQFLVGQVQSYINPAQSVVSPAIIAPNRDQKVGKQNKLLIPKINVDVPVVYDITTFEESAVQAGLERGVVHYGTTALPGEKGNNVIVGHSSNNFWNNGRHKFAFVLLNKLRDGDTFTLHYGGKAYTYEVFQRRIVKPTEVDVIFEDFNEPVVTLITCDPPGTSWNRLVVNARQISPDPDQANEPTRKVERPDEVITVPSDSTSLLDNLFN